MLTAINKRIVNILRKAPPGDPAVQPSALTEAAEIALHGVTTYAGPNTQHVQFWNEPDNFLYKEDHAFNREHYALMTKMGG